MERSDVKLSRPTLPTTFQGGCHCGRVRFAVTLRSFRLTECNCSMCTKKGFRHLIVPADDFVLQSGGDALATYTFNTGVAKHHFCSVCGVHSFYVPRSHPDGFSVNQRCLDGAPLAWFDCEPFDGRNWERQIEQFR